MLVPALSLVSILSNYASAATVPTYSATKCCCNGFSLKFVQEEQISRFTYECRTSHLFPAMSDGNCSEKNVKWEILRSKHLFGLKLHTDVSLLPPTLLSSTPPPPIILPSPICDVCLCLCLSGASLNHFFSHFDSSSVKRKLLRIMTPAEESMTMTYDSYIKEQLWTSSFIYVAYSLMASFCKKVRYLSTMSLTGYQLCAEQEEGQSESSCQNTPAVLPWMCASQGGSMATTRCPWQPSRTKSWLLP